MSAPDKLNLEQHISSKDKKQLYVTRMFATIAPRYDFITALFSYGMDRGWKRKLVTMLDLRGHERVLDLACGTGDITFAVARRLTSGHVTGLDVTQPMLDIAERKRHDFALSKVAFQLGDIMRMPFADESFDCVTAGYALRNVPDIETALTEILRVLKPGGCFYSLDFGHPRSRIYRWLYLHYLTVTGSLAGLALHRDADVYRYIAESLKLYPGQRGVCELMTRAGFINTGFHEFGGGITAINHGVKPR